MIYLQAPACMLVGSSPEILCRVEDGIVTNRPLAGTRRRGATPRRTRRWSTSCSPTTRSGPSTSCSSIWTATTSAASREPGSIDLQRLMDVERYSHVMHLTSTVTGRLRAAGLLGRAARHAAGGHGERRPEGARDADHRRAGARRAAAPTAAASAT